MDLNRLFNIAKHQFTEEQILAFFYDNKKQSIMNYKDFLCVDYTKFGFEFIRGEISCTGIRFEFKKPNYDLSVHRFKEVYSDDFFDSVLLSPKYTKEHFEKSKTGTIRLKAKDIRSEKDFIKLQKSITKRFPFDNQLELF